MEEYIAGPEFGQKFIDLVHRVITEYLADTNVAENIFMSILYQPSAEYLLDNRFEERIKPYMGNTLPLLIDRMIRHQLARCDNSCSPQPAAADRQEGIRMAF